MSAKTKNTTGHGQRQTPPTTRPEGGHPQTERERRASLLAKITPISPMPSREEAKRNHARVVESKQIPVEDCPPASEAVLGGALGEISEVKKLMSSIIQLKKRILNSKSQLEKMEILLEFLDILD